MKGAVNGALMLIVNGLVTHVPCWTIRKTVLRLCGMKIGRGSRILMGCRFQYPQGISIGSHTYINAKCHLDGRGGLVIGDNVNISNYCKIITASHDMHSSSFAYRTGRVLIDNYVWLGTGAIILDRSHLGEAMILGAGSVFKGEGRAGVVYAGNPAQPTKDRKLEGKYDIIWKPWFE